MVVEQRRPTFSDPELQAELDRTGWVVVPLLDVDEARDLRATLERFVPPDPPPMFSPHRGDTIEDRIAMSEIVADRLLGPTQDLIPDHRPLMASIIAKRPGADSELPLHRDWNFVDESRFTSVLVWVALEDVSPDNGGLYAVAGSHRLGQTYRGSGPGEWPPSEDGVRDELVERYLTHIEVPTGHACIFDNSILHGSLPNSSDRIRIVAAATLAPIEADVIHYYVDADQRRYRYHLDPTFLMRVHELDRVFEGDHVRGVEEVDLTLLRFGADELDRLVPTSKPAPTGDAIAEQGSPSLERRRRWYELGRLRRS